MILTFALINWHSTKEIPSSISSSSGHLGNIPRITALSDVITFCVIHSLPWPAVAKIPKTTTTMPRQLAHPGVDFFSTIFGIVISLKIYDRFFYKKDRLFGEAVKSNLLRIMFCSHRIVSLQFSCLLGHATTTTALGSSKIF